MTIQENINRCVHLETEVKKHPMCFNFEETSKFYQVIYPFEARGLNGARACKSKGKALARMEKDWNGEDIGAHPDV